MLLLNLGSLNPFLYLNPAGINSTLESDILCLRLLKHIYCISLTNFFFLRHHLIIDKYEDKNIMIVINPAECNIFLKKPSFLFLLCIHYLYYCVDWYLMHCFCAFKFFIRYNFNIKCFCSTLQNVMSWNTLRTYLLILYLNIKKQECYLKALERNVLHFHYV